MTISVGVDTLCWHMRIEAGAVTVEQVLEAAAELGVPVVTLNLHHVRDQSVAELERLRERAADLRLRLLAQGDFVGSPRKGDRPADGVSRIESWLERARALESPTLRLASGFYRADLAASPELIVDERRYVTAVLSGAADLASQEGIRLILENHSDFTVAEYEDIVRDVGADRMGVFLDLINPIVTFDDPISAIERLAPLAQSGHIRDFELRSIQQPDAYHRRGFEVLYRYPGEGVAPVHGLLGALARVVGDRPYDLLIEGLDSLADVDDQHERLARALAVVRDVLGEQGRVNAIRGRNGP
ncbi:MAG TPA: TIM barrel protein [Actinomycetota bacterium]|nr:TIM barrel protein [Actinomycetota bacterium]